MRIKQLTEINDDSVLRVFEKDSNNREINIYSLTNVMITGESLHYPNTLVYQVTDDVLYNPINEKTMSLKEVVTNDDFDITVKQQTKTEEQSVFFFIYNMDNYFHFVYDSLPYLISFNKIKINKPQIKLLMNYPVGKEHFYKFVTEFLSILGITHNDIIIADENTLYKEILISTSYTHDFDSNLPPKNEIYEFYQEIVDKVNIDTKDLPKKIYVSRRSWLHGDVSNIGTNYTNRRKLVNEDDLVDFLVSKGYEEIFTETFTTEQKIALFKNAESVIGSIGGGVCNVLFSNPKCKLTTLVSPYFLDVNKRFIYSLNNVDLTLFNDAKNTETTYFKKYMRVKYGEIIGEIIEIDGDDITITYSDTRLSGWNSENKYKTMTLKSQDCVRLDEGLNSSWKINLEEFKKIL
jgi:capsular polysaccharide biosynthesis protein